MKSKKILCLDLSSTSTGFAVFEINTKTARLLDFGQIETQSKDSHGKKYNYIRGSIRKLIKDNKIIEVIIESYYMTRGKGALVCVELRGICKEEFHLRNVNFHEYSPITIKKMVTGYGKATKEDMVRSAIKIFKIKVDRIEALKSVTRFYINGKKFKDDAADAIGIGICHSKKIMSNPKFIYEQGR